ncbi:unnamed protein product [Protopolystoma xenopodis]|uniref:Uncharacterized protein n=1 Tax=Protopolystoma xenopodis TaxID=117903 RepID=A0A3S5CPQ3_9PLAT|nr:unnamed protein product [Protopolystoma xenopodis]
MFIIYCAPPTSSHAQQVPHEFMELLSRELFVLVLIDAFEIARLVYVQPIEEFVELAGRHAAKEAEGGEGRGGGYGEQTECGAEYSDVSDGNDDDYDVDVESYAAEAITTSNNK